MLGQQSNLTVPQAPGIQNRQCVAQLHLLKHLRLELRHGGFRDRPPDIMAEVEKPVPVDIGLSHIEVTTDQGYQQGIESIINKLGEDLVSFVKVGPTAFLVLESRWFKPFDFGDLVMLVSRIIVIIRMQRPLTEGKENKKLSNVRQTVPSDPA